MVLVTRCWGWNVLRYEVLVQSSIKESFANSAMWVCLTEFHVAEMVHKMLTIRCWYCGPGTYWLITDSTYCQGLCGHTESFNNWYVSVIPDQCIRWWRGCFTIWMRIGHINTSFVISFQEIIDEVQSLDCRCLLL